MTETQKVSHTVGISWSDLHPGCLSSVIEYTKSIGANAIQLVISHSKGTSYIPNDDDIETRINNLDVFIVAHGMYTINLCNRGSQFNFAKRELIKQLNVCEKLQCDIVIHQGKNTKNLPIEHAMKLYVDAITEIIRESKTEIPKVLLENSCHAGTEMGYNITQLAQIFNMFPPDVKPRIGFCLDTCHAFVAGELDMRDVEAVKRFITDFDTQIGLNNLCLIHINDSKSKFGTHSDRHASWMNGYMTNQHVLSTTEMQNSLHGLMYFLVVLGLRNQIPMTLETDFDKYTFDMVFLINLMYSTFNKASKESLEKLFQDVSSCTLYYKQIELDKQK